jgi:mannosyltransferase OCH1-like enzyme
MNHPYVRDMYDKKLWAFASDYIRAKALFEEGGVSIGTDMEILKPLDDLLGNEVFLGKTSSDGYVSSGIVGAVPKHPFAHTWMHFYDTDTERSIKNTAPVVLSNIYACDQSYKNRIRVYPPKYFYPCNAGELCTKEKTREAYTNNHWAESWRRFPRLRKVIRKFARRSGLYPLLQRINRLLHW